MARYAAVLDACVLVPVSLADTLLRVAESGLYRPLWSGRILDEAMDAIRAIHPDIEAHRIAKRMSEMEQAFEDARVEGWEALEDAVSLPDPDDRHVVAAALQGKADAIVTVNLRDYPADVLDRLAIEVIDPDRFLLNQLDLAPRVVLGVLREQAAHMRHPPLTPVDLVSRLARAGVPRFADEVGRLV